MKLLILNIEAAKLRHSSTIVFPLWVQFWASKENKIQPVAL